MTDDVMHAKLMEVVDILLFEPAEVDLGDVCAMVKCDLGIANDREVKRLTYEAVREMLRRGAQVDFDGGGKSSRASTASGKPSERCRPFPEKSASSNGRSPQWRHMPDVANRSRHDSGA